MTPLAVATAALVGLARIGVAAIQEMLPLWVAGLLCVALLVWPVIATHRARRRHRARLAELCNPMTGFRPLAEPLSPLPMGVRAWLIAAPLLALGALVLAATTPGAGDTCASKGISSPAAREGNCLREANLFGRGVTYNVVDAGHVLHMPRLDAELLATRTQAVIITDPQESPSFYPDGTGTLVGSFCWGGGQFPVFAGVFGWFGWLM